MNTMRLVLLVPCLCLCALAGCEPPRIPAPEKAKATEPPKRAEAPRPPAKKKPAVKPAGEPKPEARAEAKPNEPELPSPGKTYQGRALKEWAAGLEDLDPDVAFRATGAVEAFGEDGWPWLMKTAKKHKVGSEHRQIVADGIRIPKAGAWRDPIIAFLRELTSDPNGITSNQARATLDRAGLLPEKK
jgi:hypothetical protein